MRQLVLLLGGLIGSLAGKPPGERQLTILRRDPAPTGASGQTQYAVFAAGCFWGVELAFARLPGVLYTDVGYTGGTTESPTYTTVSRGTTGHAEAVRIGYDPSLISYEMLLDVFFDCHDPTTRNRQGNDVGTQYRSAIFYATPEERAAAEAAAATFSERTGRSVATTMEAFETFYPAEGYHQQYLARLGQSDAKGETAPIRCYG